METPAHVLAYDARKLYLAIIIVQRMDVGYCDKYSGNCYCGSINLLTNTTNSARVRNV